MLVCSWNLLISPSRFPSRVTWWLCLLVHRSVVPRVVEIELDSDWRHRLVALAKRLCSECRMRCSWLPSRPLIRKIILLTHPWMSFCVLVCCWPRWALVLLPSVPCLTTMFVVTESGPTRDSLVTSATSLTTRMLLHELCSLTQFPRSVPSPGPLSLCSCLMGLRMRVVLLVVSCGRWVLLRVKRLVIRNVS